MASGAYLPSDPNHLLQILDDMLDEIESDDDFEGYLESDEGPVAYRRGHESPPMHRSLSLDSLLEAGDEALETPLARTSPSLSPMQGENASGSPLQLQQTTDSSPLLSRYYITKLS